MLPSLQVSDLPSCLIDEEDKEQRFSESLYILFPIWDLEDPGRQSLVQEILREGLFPGPPQESDSPSLRETGEPVFFYSVISASIFDSAKNPFK